MNDDPIALQQRLLPEIRAFRDGCQTLMMATLDQGANPNVSLFLLRYKTMAIMS